MHEKLGAYSGGIRAATSQFSGAGEGGPNQLAFEAAVTNVATEHTIAPETFVLTSITSIVRRAKG